MYAVIKNFLHITQFLLAQKGHWFENIVNS